MRYAVHDRNGWPLAMLGFSTAAWRLAPRDNFIGWTPRRREKNLPLVVDNPRFLIPALGQNPQPRLAHPRHHPPPPARGLGRAVQHHARAHRDLRRDTALHRCRLQGFRLDPCRRHQGARPLRPGQTVRQAQKGRLAAPPPTGLEANPQSVKSPGRRTLTARFPIQFANTEHRKRLRVEPVMNISNQGSVLIFVVSSNGLFYNH